MSRRALGSLALVALYAFPPELFFAAALLMAAEQAGFTTTTAAVAVPVLRAVSKTPLATDLNKF